MGSSILSPVMARIVVIAILALLVYLSVYWVNTVRRLERVERLYLQAQSELDICDREHKPLPRLRELTRKARLKQALWGCALPD